MQNLKKIFFDPDYGQRVQRSPSPPDNLKTESEKVLDPAGQTPQEPFAVFVLRFQREPGLTSRAEVLRRGQFEWIVTRKQCDGVTRVNRCGCDLIGLIVVHGC